jgi:RHS repeat-associated protein
VFSWDTASSLPQALATSAGAIYLYGLDLVAQQQSNAWQYPLGDSLGSVRQWTDDEGTVTYAVGYAPFGEELWRTGSAASAWGYTGEWQDTDVGLVYLRARWYDPTIGILAQRDPFPGLRTQPFSLHSYVYVLANPVNATDPSGLYHSDVHYDLTKKWALEIANSYGFSYMGRTIASEIAEGDENVDRSGVLEAILGCRSCHFCPFLRTITHVKNAIESYRVSPFLFGATLHQLQDFYAHWNEGYDEGGYGGDSIGAGAFPGNHLRSPGGKSKRTAWQLEDFFLGGHFEDHGWGSQWVESPYPAHPRDEVIADIRSRNLAIDLNGLNDDDLIDLYLRREPCQDPDWEQRVQERRHFGIDPDAYIETSTRDTIMRQNSRSQIRLFIQRIVSDPCSVYFARPDDDVIKAWLTE